ncbi:MAG: hypothetical protein IJN57_10780 [Oscillospiraceae bacterium]|nr:hypothetical protein [Oscillospiraceae bacterium]MBQ7004426.1 hypothetical protein [Oscillospiraceae bacterium]
MHAIVCQGNGKYYVSAVFGYFRDITATDDYEKYIQSIHNPYWIVWDEEKKRLIRWLHMVPDTQYIIPQILIVDSDHENWNMDDDGVGCVDFLSRDLLDSFLDLDQQPEEILEKCRSMDAGYIYEEIQEIKGQKEIDNLDWASGGFHDARIAKEELQQDGTLYLRFDGTWGCEIEVWLWGDLEYDTSSRNPDHCDPYWQGSTILQKDGFLYLIDDDDMTVEQIGKGYCYFKARHMKYRIVPNLKA